MSSCKCKNCMKLKGRQVSTINGESNSKMIYVNLTPTLFNEIKKRYPGPIKFADINCLNRQGMTELMLAVKIQNFHFIDRTINEANIDIIGADGQSALQMAFDQRYSSSWIVPLFVHKLKTTSRTTEECAKRLIAAGGNMYHAASSKDVGLLQCMLRQGIAIESRGCNDCTALHRAAYENDVDSAKWLMKNGVDVNAVDKDGYSALMISLEKGSMKMIPFLLENRANPNCRDNRGCTPLHMIFDNRSRVYISHELAVWCTELLIEYGAIPQNGSEGSTIFDYALNRSSDEAINVLICKLAMLQMLGTLRTKSVMYCEIEKYKSRESGFEIFHDKCMRVLEDNVHGKMSLLDLLNESHKNMKILVRKETFAADVEKFETKYKLNESFPFYNKMLKKRILKAIDVVKLEDKAMEIICKVFNSNHNECYIFTKIVVDYLNENDLLQLVQVSLD